VREGKNKFRIVRVLTKVEAEAVKLPQQNHGNNKIRVFQKHGSAPSHRGGETALKPQQACA
jgi:hypothetical protein